MIQESYDINFFFPVKAEMLLFSNLMTGGPRGDLQRVNFSLNINMSTKIFRISKNFKVKFTLCKSPRGPPVIKFEKSNISAFTGKKKLMSQLSQIIFYLSSKHGIENSPKMQTLAGGRENKPLFIYYVFFYKAKNRTHLFSKR